MTATIDCDVQRVPAVLTQRPQWVAWRWTERNGKRTKEPINPRTGMKGESNNPATWGTVEAAIARAERDNLAGIGYVFSPDDPYAGIDLDDCRDPVTGELEPDAAAIVAALDSYTEVSPSGTGVKVFIAAGHPGAGHRKQRAWDSGAIGEVEMYDRGRYFAVTGQQLEGTPATINPRQAQFDQLHRQTFGERGRQAEPPTRMTTGAGMTDAEIVAAAMQARNGGKFAALWRGVTSAYADDDSRADAALCAMLAFYTRDPDQIDRLFRQSGLYREKWERADYRGWTIDGALGIVTEQYTPPPRDIPHASNRYHDPTDPAPAAPAGPAWPDPLADAAYHGLAGEIVRAIEPETEADPVALLLTLLTAVGNIVGTGPHWRVGLREHGLRLFVVFVGATSKARKGTSWGAIKPLFRLSFPDWLKTQVASGLSSGEGLIYCVRDEMKKIEPIKERGRIIDYQEVIVDPGVDDKRLFVIEEEFASVLKVMSRESNILSAIIRQAWDDGDLRTLTKNTPMTATGAQISTVGHVTQHELLRYLDDTEAGNGFANRFLWACVRRSKILPDGGRPDPAVLADLARQLQAVVRTSEHIGLIQRDAGAAELWREVYGPLSEGGVGLMGAITSRAEAQVMRLAAIYAVLDETPDLTVEHLNAALAIWRYLDQSAAVIFGDKLGDPTADTILRALREIGEMTQSEISNMFGRNLSAARIDRALGLLATAGTVTRSTRETGGRPAVVWSAR